MFVSVVKSKRNRQKKWRKATKPFDLEFKFWTFSKIYAKRIITYRVPGYGSYIMQNY